MNDPVPSAELVKLLAHLRFSKDDSKLGSLWFVACDDFKQQQALADEIAATAPDTYAVLHFSFKEAHKGNIWDVIREQNASQPCLVLARDLDHLDQADLTRTLDQLNRGREALASRPIHMVMFLLEPSVREFILKAGDFWSWRSGYTAVTRQEKPSFGEAAYQSLAVRYLEWLEADAFYDERERMRGLNTLLQESDIAWFVRRGIDEKGARHPLEPLVGSSRLQLITAPFGYFKSKEFLAFFESLLGKKGFDLSQQLIPVALDFEKLDDDQALFSETNLKIIFGAYSLFFDPAQFEFHFFGHKLELLSEATQVRYAKELNALLAQKPRSKAVLVGAEGYTNVPAFGDYAHVRIAPVPYRWLEHWMWQKYNYDYLYLTDFHEPLKKFENVILVLEVYETIKRAIPNLHYILFQTDQTTKKLNQTMITTPVYRAPSTFNEAPGFDKLEMVYSTHATMFVHSSKLFNRSIAQQIKKVHIGYIYNNKEFEAVKKSNLYSLGIFDFDESILLKVNYQKIMMIVTDYIQNRSFTPKPKAIHFASNYIYNHLLFQQKNLDLRSQESMLIHLISLHVTIENWTKFHHKSTITMISILQKWFLAKDRIFFLEEDKADWLVPLYKSHLTPLFRQHLAPILEQAAKEHPDPITRQISKLALKPPPLPAYALDEEEDV